MSSNYEANRHVAQQRLQARRAEAARERLLNSGRPGKPGLVQRFRTWLGSRAQTYLKRKDTQTTGARRKAA